MARGEDGGTHTCRAPSAQRLCRDVEAPGGSGAAPPSATAPAAQAAKDSVRRWPPERERERESLFQSENDE